MAIKYSERGAKSPTREYSGTKNGPAYQQYHYNDRDSSYKYRQKEKDPRATYDYGGSGYSNDRSGAYRPAPSARNGGSGRGGSGKSEGNGRENGASTGTGSLNPKVLAERGLDEARAQACYQLIADMLAYAKPFPRVAYPTWTEGHSSDRTMYPMNRGGLQRPLNIGFAEMFVQFKRRFIIDGFKRIQIHPQYGIVSYIPEKKVLEGMKGAKKILRGLGMKVNDEFIQVHRSAEDIRGFFEHPDMQFFPPDVTVQILYGLADSGRRINPEHLEKAVQLGILSVNSEQQGVVIIPTKERVFKIHVINGKSEGIEDGDIRTLAKIVRNIKNGEEVFGHSKGKRRATRQGQAIEIVLGQVSSSDTFFSIIYEGKQYKVNDTDPQNITLELISSPVSKRRKK